MITCIINDAKTTGGLWSLEVLVFYSHRAHFKVFQRHTSAAHLNRSFPILHMRVPSCGHFLKAAMTLR